MALTAVERTNIVKLTVALYNAAPGASGLSDFTTFYEANGRNLTTLANNLTSNNIFKSLYPNFQTVGDFATSILSIYGLQGNTDAVAFVTSKFNSGLSKGQIAFETALAINNTTAAVGDFADARNVLNNKTMVAENYSVALSGQSTNIGVLQNVLNGVTSDPASVIASNNVNGGVAGGSLVLTTGFDNLVGTSSNDTFTANVVQNSAGQQTNQLATGDKINGGAGVDTLNARVQMGTALGGSPNSSIAPITTSVEQTFFTALTVNNTASGLTGISPAAAEVVNINAKSMTGLTKVGSVQSDASLLIQNLTTLTDSSLYADRRLTDSVAVRMDHSGNDTTPNAASNLTVLFDNDYLLSNLVNSNRLELRLANNLPLKNTFQPLAGFASVSFKVGAADVTTLITAPVQALTGPAAYAALKVLIDAQLASQGIIGVAVNLLPQETTIFSIPLEGNAQGSAAGVFTPIQVVSTGGQLGLGTIQLGTNLVSFNGVNTETLGGASAVQTPITSNIELYKVGRGSDGGSLVVGAMGTDLTNNLNYSTTALKQGVEQFNIVVSGDTTQMSSLSNLSSTNNTLKIVNVSYDVNSTNPAGTLADLIIGNKNTVGVLSSVNGDVDSRSDGMFNVSSVKNLAMKDVLTFTATDNNSDASNPLSVQTNDVTLNAYLSDQVVAKYMNRVDTASNAAADNANFVYTTGNGNDVINLNISKTNLAALGTGTREDFSLLINAGGGNNAVTTQIGNGVGVSYNAAGFGLPVNADLNTWFINETINKNLTITTGVGNDVVRVNGAGSWTINTGDGNDTVYSDNSGRQVITLANVVSESNAVWVFNSANQGQGTIGQQYLADLQSATPVTVALKVANLTLTVGYRGLSTVAVAVGDTASAAGGSVDDLTINQAIKAAINSDIYLKNLLIAQDGPGRTLIVTSLTDGVFSDADLTINVASSTASAAQTAGNVLVASAAQLNALGFSAAGTFAANGRFDSALADQNTFFQAEQAFVTFGAIGNLGGVETVGGLTITGIATGTAVGYTDVQVATVANGGTVAGLTITTAPTAFVVTKAAFNANSAIFTTILYGNQPDVGTYTLSNSGGAAPTSNTFQQGFGDPSITGANSFQPNANVIDAGLGLDTVVLSTAGTFINGNGTSTVLSKETVNVANVVPDADVVFNASAGSTITVDILDKVITSSGLVVTGGSGTMTVQTNGITGTAGNDTINASNVVGGQTITGGAGSDTITFAVNGAVIDTVVFNSLIGADTINNFAANDLVQLSLATFTALGAVGPLTAAQFESNTSTTGASASGTVRFIYNTATGTLFYDADGSAAAIAPVLVGTFTGNPGLTVGNFSIIA